jgi:hypothetical protein
LKNLRLEPKLVIVGKKYRAGTVICPFTGLKIMTGTNIVNSLSRFFIVGGQL